MATRANSLAAAVLAVIGPLVVGALGFQGLMTFRDQEEATAERNAGRVVNAQVIDRGVVPAMDAVLSARQPEVVILGPSYANTDVRPELLAAALGVRPDRVVLLSVPNSVGAHWYAILAHRVFGNGHRPKLVVLVSGLQSMLIATPLTEASYVNLETQLPPGGDPVVSAKAQTSASMLWARMREQRGKVRARWFDLLRSVPVAALMQSTRGGGPMGPIEARFHLDAVFDDAGVDMSLHGHSTPVVEANRGQQRFYGPEHLPLPPDSFMPDVTALAAEHGARVVWVRPPMSPHILEYLDDRVLPGVQEAAVETVERLGGSFVDMRGLPMTSAMFKNEDHMNEEGSRRFSLALGRALLELDAMEPQAVPSDLPPLQWTESQSSEATVSPELMAWPGDGRWVSPGQTVSWEAGAGWDPRRGTFAVHLVVDGPDAADAPVVEVDGRPVLMTATPMPGGHAMWLGRLRPPRPDGPVRIELARGAGSPPVRVVALSVGWRAGRTFVVGDALALEGAEAPLIAGVGHPELQGTTPTFAAPPVKPPGASRPVTDLPGEVAAFETERWAFLSDEALVGETAFGSRCSPLRIDEDGALLGGANVPCLEVKRADDGRSCHTLDRIFFTASDGTDPATNGRAYRLALAPERLCDGAVWVYPKDALQMRWPADAFDDFRVGARFLTLGRPVPQPASSRHHRSADGRWRDVGRQPGRRPRSEVPSTGVALARSRRAWSAGRDQHRQPRTHILPRQRCDVVRASATQSVDVYGMTSMGKRHDA